MYFQTSIAKLSRNQLKNLLEGKRVRIKKGTAHNIHLTEAQLKKLEAANKAKKAHTISFTPHQAKHQGAGLLQDAYNFVKRTPYIRQAVNSGISASKRHLHHGVNYLSSKAHHKINSIPYIEGHGLGGLALNGAAGLSNLIGGKGSGEAADILRATGGVANFLGLGLRGPKPGTKLTEAQKEARKQKQESKLLNILGKKGRKLLYKPRKTKKATEAQIAALERGRATRAANLAAKRGGALYVAGA